ncbi:Hypothetical protein CINCED_3A021098 [Cinara cedri]|uniref:Probable ATP-dependent RNA helicase spindle-E n=1 Tax=Cinara cedri TaxID=506608 RepID=A0A5E4MNQ2_9HEMI|nr:Hypothetical protein CINCED_3A021098 [Cinara cedri]
MLKLLAENKLKKKIIPGSNIQSTIPKMEHLFDSYSYNSHLDTQHLTSHSDGKNYVNINLEEDENEEYVEIVQITNANCVVLISGPTGCGKSTQVPQFILDDCMNRKKFCNIVVTQPRRIAAINVCKQVNNERNWRNGLLVGYQVGRKKDYDPNTTKVLFCTTGILLQKIISAKNLNDFTHIILDEVHERTLEMDFLLLIIKKLLKTNSPSTRVVLMSATAQDFKLCDYFSDYYGSPYNCYVKAQQISIPRNLQFNVSLHYLDELYGLIPSARAMEFNRPQITKAGYDTAINLVKGFDDLEKDYSIKASVLIFLPGIFEIEEMHRLMEYAIVSEKIKWKLLPLHSSITNEEQQRVFEQPSVHYRKIILATNIAESSITVPDVSYVVDFCLMKQFKNELKSNYSMLVLNWASKNNCIQRSGRVGRVADGKVYRLVPEQMFVKDFSKEEVPEMSRCSLSRIVLMSKILDMGTPKLLLSCAMDPPDLKNIIHTIMNLKQVGALLPTVNGVISSVDGDITFMGKVMAQLPLEPSMTKLIYFGYIFNILNEAIIMACGISIKSIFSQPFNKRLEAYTQKLFWANNSCSDPIAYIAAYESWLQRKPEFDRDRYNEKLWAQKNYIQLSAIRELYDLIDDVVFRLKQNVKISPNSGNIQWVKHEEKSMACKVILAGAFYPNYFISETSNTYMDSHAILKLLDEHDPNQTVYFTGFPSNQPKELYKEAIENLFPHNLVGKPTAHFGYSNKIFIKFPVSKSINTNTYNSDYNENNGKLLIPGNICFGVYVALKMQQLRFDFNIPLLKPLDAEKRVVLMSKQMASQNISIEKKFPIQKSIIEELNTKTTIDITVSYFQSVGCFWAQLVDQNNKEKLQKMWNLVNEVIKSLEKVNHKDLNIGDFYIVIYKNEKYRAKLIKFLNGKPKKYQFFLIDFGEIINLLIENIFSILNEDDRGRVYSFPTLAFQCKIAKIRPMLHGQINSNWSDKANSVFINYGIYTKQLRGTIYSLVNGVVSFENLYYFDGNNFNSIPENLIYKNLASQTEETFTSKIDHVKRSNTIKKTSTTSNALNPESNNMCLNLKSSSYNESHIQHCLKGPSSPLIRSIRGFSCNSLNKAVKIESQSVNSVLLDTDPNDYHERLLVAGKVCMNENQKLTLWDSTMMPNIPGIPSILCLMFSPCVEIRYNSSYTKMIGAICGLGYNPDTLRPLFEDNDIELTFDIAVDHNLLNKINVLRLLLNKCVNPEDKEGPGDIFQIQHSLQNSLIEIFSIPVKFKVQEIVPKKYVWGIIPKSRLQSPYQEDSPMKNPMDGSDVYKLLWGVVLSPSMSSTECKEILHNLYKIKRLEEIFSKNHFSAESYTDELYCPLCHLSFSNNKSMRIHFDNYQHKERYTNCKEELKRFYRGPSSDIEHL